MSVRLTDASHVALYDGTTGVAFGPTFESEDHANDFVRFLAHREPDLHADTMPLRQLFAYHDLWFDERGGRDEYPVCPVCCEPIDYCQGHGEDNATDPITASPG